MIRLFETMQRHAVEAPQKVAVTDSHGSITRSDLLSKAQGLASELVEQPQTIGILAPNGIEWVVAQLACAFAGKTAVPLPSFFSSAQIGHVVRNASIGSILTTNEMAPLASGSGVPTSLINHSSPMDSFQPLPGVHPRKIRLNELQVILDVLVIRPSWIVRIFLPQSAN
jgi:long-subunit acyl-CoA synthetase (AMP-forming)